MPQYPIISVIIVSWNVSQYLKKCLNSLFNNISFPCEIIVVDNFSSDTTKVVLEEFKKSAPQNISFKIILNTQNNGFAKANNQGIEMARGEYLLLLNPDTEIFPDTVPLMQNFFEHHPECGIAGCQHRNSDFTIQPSVRRLPDLFSQILILLKLHRIFPQLPPLKKYFVHDFNYNVTQRVDQVAGSFFMFPKNLLEKIGKLDEQFYIWFEEVDFCKRAKDAGYEIYYVASTKIKHFGGKSFSNIHSPKKQKMFNASLRRYFAKHKNFISWLILIVLHPISMLLSYLSACISHEPKKSG